MQFTAREIEDFSHSSTDCLVLPVPEKPKRLQGVLAEADKLAAGLLRQVLDSGDFSGKKGQHTTLYLPRPARIRRLLLVGTGKAARGNASRHDFLEWSRLVGQCLHRLQAADAIACTEGLPAVAEDPAWAARQLALAISAAQYRYDATLSAKAPKPVLRKVTVHGCGEGNARLRQALKTGHAIAEGIHLAKELGNLPGNICTPSYLAAEARKLAKRHKAVSCQVLDERRMRELGMGSFLSVTRGTQEPARLIVLQYQGAARTQKPVVLVGKGITFDSGGISLKPGAKMDEMKYDMCGAASVLGTLQAAASLALPINLVGIIAAAENLPSGSATKPGDIVTSMSGKTIEILNTDAEGRLVLCDALTYAARFKPDIVIDIATLTGACVVALGEHASGLFSNDDSLADDLLAAGQDTGDRAWRMPLWSDYQKQLKSPFADIANIGGPSAGSITAACFLARFTEDYTWAHLDIAGTAWQSSPKTATGRPVALLCQYLVNRAGAA